MSGDPGYVRSGEDRNANPGQRPVGGNGDDRRVSRGQKGFIGFSRANLDLVVWTVLVAFDDDDVDVPEPAKEFGQCGLAFVAELADVGPAGCRGNDHLACPRLTVAPAVLARAVDVEIMMGVLDRGDAHAPSCQLFHDPDHESRFPRILETGNTDDKWLVGPARIVHSMYALHVTTIVLTITGFCLRAYWMARRSALLESLPSRVLPHVNDTILLVSGVWLAARSGQYPFVDAWLTAKLTGLVAYIVLGALALRYAPTIRLRLLALVGALLCVGYVVAVALTRDAWPRAIL